MAPRPVSHGWSKVKDARFQCGDIVIYDNIITIVIYDGRIANGLQARLLGVDNERSLV